MSQTKTLYCACCGGYTLGRQWFNQDIGYGLCSACAVRIKAKSCYTSAEFNRLYGEEGFHYPDEQNKMTEERRSQTSEV